MSYSTDPVEDAARHFDPLFQSAEEQEKADAEAEQQLFKACDAIRNMKINVSNVRQLLSTIASAAIEQGWTDAMVYPLDIAQTELDE